MNTPAHTEPPSLPHNAKTRFRLEPLHGRINVISILEGILKYPGRVLYEIKSGRALPTAFALALLALISLFVYGLVVGSASGGSQIWIAPAKILVGSALCGLICLPSLYIFLCLSGADTTLKQVGGELLASVVLTALLLIGFAPVAWVLSQSTNSIALMSFLHLIFWAVALGFGLRLIGRDTAINQRWNTGIWIVIYIFVCLQMMTSLRPIVGTADTFLPTKKQFFLEHMGEALGYSSERN